MTNPANMTIVERTWQVYLQIIEVLGSSESVLFVSQESRKRLVHFRSCGGTQNGKEPNMAATPWYVEIVHVSSRQRQQDLLTLLHEVAGVTALGSSSGSGHFVIFECPDVRLKIAVEKLFSDVDPASVLAETHHPRLQPEGDGVA